MQSQVRLNRVSEKVPEKVWEALVQSAEPGQVQQGSGEGSGEALVQSQVRFNRVPRRRFQRLASQHAQKDL